MSSPGGSGNWGPYNSGHNEYYDPITGQPVGQVPPAGGPQGQPKTQYQGFGVFDQQQSGSGYPGMISGFPEPAAKPKSNAPVIVSVAVAAVAMIAVATTIIVANKNDDEPTSPPVAAPSSTRTQVPSTKPTSPPAEDPAGLFAQVPPTVPGWKGMGWKKFGVAYDVPSTWEPSKPGEISGVENKAGERSALSAYSVYLLNACPEVKGSFRAKVGVSSSPEPDPLKAANDTIQQWARLGWTVNNVAPQVTPNPPVPTQLMGKEGHLVSATITPAGQEGCGAPSTYISIGTLKGENGTVMILGLADQGVPGAASTEDINRSLTTLRRLPK